MPSGYTSKLYDGEQSFEDFALGVARGFGALVTMRDEPADAPIPDEFGPNSYYVKAVDEAREDLRAALAMTNWEAARSERGERHEAEQYRAEYIAKKAALRRRYEAMLEKAEAFVPPTPDHEEFKATMVRQLRESIEFDCGGSYVPAVPEPRSAERYRADAIAKARDELARAEERLADEKMRAHKRTEWVQALRQAIEAVPA